METIKVNMSPNPLDVQTIHASQNDGEARQWKFELHNNGELIDTSNVKEQLVFKAYKGGTEQILPENTSTPTTSPFKGDIRYPQGLLADQEFLYRQSPTEEDGLAKITDIKGNTLVWNQLVENGDFASTSRWSVNNITTYSVANNTLTFSFSSNDGFIGHAGIPLTKNHKYLWLMDFKTDLPSPYRENIKIQNYRNGGWSIANRVSNNNWNTYSTIFTFTEDSVTVTAPFFRLVSYTDGAIAISNSNQIRNVQVFDLTQMFGSSKADEIYAMEQATEGSGIAYFKSLFPLPYYAYNQGSLLSFNGNGIKTTGKNEADIPFEQGAVSQTINFSYQASKVSSATRIRCVSLAVAEKDKIYKCDWNTSIYDCVVQAYGENRLSTGASGIPFNTWHTTSFTFTGTGYVAIAFKRKDGANITPSEIDAIRPNLYLADTETITNLPISTYFPTGMKSAGNVYDELTESKAITRIGAVDLGSLEWGINNTDTQDIKRMKATALRNVISKPSSASAIANVVCANYKAVSADATYLKTVGVAIDSGGDVLIYDPNYNQQSSTSAFKTAMSGVYLYYELATPTETSFTTASLVTENAEIPLSNEDGVLIGKCTEQLSSESGFIDAKIKLADEDGDVYSNKIQLHVERSPQ